MGLSVSLPGIHKAKVSIPTDEVINKYLNTACIVSIDHLRGYPILIIASISFHEHGMLFHIGALCVACVCYVWSMFLSQELLSQSDLDVPQLVQQSSVVFTVWVLGCYCQTIPKIYLFLFLLQWWQLSNSACWVKRLWCSLWWGKHRQSGSRTSPKLWKEANKPIWFPRENSGGIESICSWGLRCYYVSILEGILTTGLHVALSRLELIYVVEPDLELLMTQSAQEYRPVPLCLAWLILKIFVFIVYIGCLCTCTRSWRSEDNLWESVLSFLL